MTPADIVRLFVEIEQRLIRSLKRNLHRHKAWEQEEGFEWPAWQALKLRSFGRFRRENRDIVDDYKLAIDEETAALLREQYEEGRQAIDDEVQALRDAGYDVAPGAELHRQPVTDDNFFGVDAPRMKKLIDEVKNTQSVAEKAALRMMDDVYRQSLYRAEVAMAAGATTLPQAIDMAVKEFLEKGITCIVYKDGSRHNIADYAQMALRTAATRSKLQGEAQRRKELGIDTVLVSQYGACSDTCLPWQGRVYIDDVWGDFDGEISGDRGKSKNGKWYPLLSVAVRAGLFHPNCRHTLSTWYDGISTLPKPLDTAKVKENAQLEQQQRSMEREVRKWKRLAEGTQTPELSEAYRRKTKEAEKNLREFVRQHDAVLRRDPWRERTLRVPEIGSSLENQRETGYTDTVKPTKVLFGHQRIPPTGEPNEVIDIIGRDGKVNSRTIRDDSGKVVRQINSSNHGNPKNHPFGEHGEHAHDITWKNGKSTRTTRNLTDQERKEHKDIL